VTQRSDLGTLGEFLCASRSRLSPEDVGIRVDPRRRRVPGLRREEIAMLAGVSSSYYTRLEQGQSANASPQVLAALARALGLSQAERGHLEALGRAGLRRPSPDEPEPEVVAPAFLELLDTLGEAPAMVVGQRRDILAWNRTGHALFAGHVDAHAVHDPLARPNATALVFLDRHTRELYADWNDKAQASVGHLRILAAQQPNDARLLELIGRLIVQSLEFARMWATNQIRSTSSATYRMRHPLVGYLEVTQQLLTSAETVGQTLVVCTAPAGSSSAQALRLLAQLVPTSGLRPSTTVRQP